ncbi:hypothetical protein SEA_PEANAM_54 [Mycobacterium phage Peanam]|nr:hypothetical protein SEA_PEANAM_54 [Mycobacterium phage Peanam]
MSNQPLCEVCGKYDARVFDPSGAMWCKVCDAMGLGELAVREKISDRAEAIGRRFDETALFMFDAPAATEAGDPEAWEAVKLDSLDGADKAYVWADANGAHWGWLEGTGWVAWNTGKAPWNAGAVGPFVMFCSNTGFAPRISLTSIDDSAGEHDQQTADMVAHPSHYTSSPAKCSACGHPIECIDITQHMGFCLGNATKYVWRCDLKHDAIEDLRKAIQYIEFEIARREALSTTEG